MNTTIVAAVPLIVALVGVLVYALSERPKAAEIGRLAYGAGLLVTLYQLAGHLLSL